MLRASPQLVVFSYHKSGTSLFLHVMTKISTKLGLKLANYYGMVEKAPFEPDLILFPHSMLQGGIGWPYRAIRLIRDPRDIWVSGYLYHLRCEEEWCRNIDLNPGAPILWPKVDHSVAHRSEDWKRRYLERLKGKSYQQNLLARALEDGLDFELDGYTGNTLETMREWPLSGIDALDIKLEDVMADFDASMLRIFAHFGFTATQSQVALEAARSEDIRRMDDVAIRDRPQIHSRKISKWRDILSVAQIARFDARYGDLVRMLGYDALGPTRNPYEIANASAYREVRHLTGVLLSADEAVIHPVYSSFDNYVFIVPSDVKSVRLIYQVDFFGELCDANESILRRRSLRVSWIDVRTGSDELVISADDPRLTNRRDATEAVGLAFWGWTGESAEIPWAGLTGSAIVVIRCVPQPDSSISDDSHAD